MAEKHKDEEHERRLPLKRDKLTPMLSEAARELTQERARMAGVSQYGQITIPANIREHMRFKQ